MVSDVVVRRIVRAANEYSRFSVLMRVTFDSEGREIDALPAENGYLKAPVLEDRLVTLTGGRGRRFTGVQVRQEIAYQGL